jgi:hypothetical protein
LQQCDYSLALQNDALEIRMRASRQAGQILLTMEKNRGAATGSHDEIALPAPLTLKEMGIERSQSHRLQRIAQIPEPLFEDYITEAKVAQVKLSTNGPMRRVHAVEREVKMEARTRQCSVPTWQPPLKAHQTSRAIR